MVRSFLFSTCAISALITHSYAAPQQDMAPQAKPAEHLVGTITSADAAAQTVTVKEDGSGLEHVIQLQNTHTLLKVSPGAKDLKAAVRIAASDLAAGDRVDVRGSKAEPDSAAIVARSVVLMSSRELQQAHQSEVSAWQHSTGGTVSAVDPSNKKITVNVRSAEDAKPVIVDVASAAFTRYSPEHPKSANPSQLADIQTGDQVKIIGDRSEDGRSIAAQKIYSGSFKTIAATVSSIAPDGKSLVVKDLATKQAVTVSLIEDSGIHKLPPMMAMMLARRFNPDMKNTGGPGSAPGVTAPSPAGASGTSPYGAKTGESGDAGPGSGPSQRRTGSPGQAVSDGSRDASGLGTGPGGPGGMGTGAAGPGSPGRPDAGAFRGRMGNGDLSQMLDRLPKITASDLKSGDAVIVSGSPSAASKTTLLATSIVAGVEPIFQAAPGRQAQSLGDWGASLGGGAAMDAGAPPQ